MERLGTSPFNKDIQTKQFDRLEQFAALNKAPAIKFKDSVIPGKHDDHHTDILKSNGIGKRQPHVEGFSTPEGFKTRQEMSAYMKAQGYKDVPDEVHSQDMRAALEKGKVEAPKKTKVSRRQSRKEMMSE